MRVLRGSKAAVKSVAFSPDGTLLATASRENLVRVWDALTGEPRGVLDVGPGYEFTLLFAPDSRRLVVASMGNAANVWDVVDRKEVRRFYEPTNVMVQAGIGFTSAGQLALAHSGVTLYDSITWEKRGAWQPSVYGPGWYALGIEPGGHRAALGNGLLVDIRTGADLGRWHEPVQGYGGLGGSMMAWCPKKPLLAVGNRTKNVRIIDPLKAAPVIKLVSPSKYHEALAFTPDGRHLITVSNDHVARFYDTDTWAMRESLDWKIGPLKSVAVAADGSRAAAGSGSTNSGKVVIWDLD